MSARADDATYRTLQRVAIVASALIVIGIGVATYLTIEHYSANPTYACPVNSVMDCAKVTSSDYSKFLGIPVAPLGLVFFLVALPLNVPAAWRSRSQLLAKARWAWSGIGMVSVFWLIRAELELEALCLYCTIVHIVTFLLLVTVAYGSASRSMLGPEADEDDAEADDSAASAESIVADKTN